MSSNSAITTVTVTDMVRSLSDIMGRVHYKHETFNIKKGTNIIATLLPFAGRRAKIAVKDLNDFFCHSPRLDIEDIDSFQKDLSSLRNIKDNNNGGFSKWD